LVPQVLALELVVVAMSVLVVVAMLALVVAMSVLVVTMLVPPLGLGLGWVPQLVMPLRLARVCSTLLVMEVAC
jgi:hypothetical protein